MISRLKLKRAVSSTSSVDAPTKKPKVPLETPHPSLLSEGTAYKLPSSVGNHETPHDFSPLPVSTSQRLKENRSKPFKKTYGKYGKTKQLESPFESSSPEKRGAISSQAALNEPLILGGPLSSIPVLASAPSSPRQRVCTRRPSIDAPHTHLDFDLFSPSRNIDFNRPPSQMSLYDYNACSFDADLPRLAQSTPKKTIAAGYDTETDEEEGLGLGFAGGYETPEMDDDSDWTNDSLFSPPKTKPRKTEVTDVDAQPDSQVLEDLFDSLILIPSSPQRTRSLDSGLKDSILDTSDDICILAPALPINRTRSGTITGRARSGTIKSTVTSVVALRAPPTRTRSGTIIPSVIAGRSRSGSIVTSQPPAFSRARSGSIIAAPSTLASRVRSGSIVVPPPPRISVASIMRPATSTRTNMEAPPPPARVRSGSIAAPTARKRSGSLVAPPLALGRNRSGSLIGSLGRGSGGFLAPSRSSRMREEDEDSPDELDLILSEEPFTPSIVVPVRKPKAKVEKARQRAKHIEDIDDDTNGDIGDDELLLA